GSGRYPMLEEKNLYTLLEERAPWFDGRVEEIDWRLVVRFERRLATSFGRGRVWLAGDAGHMTSPVGIQSMNVGLREADELANLIADELGGAQRAEGFTAYGNGRLEEWRRLLGLDGRDPATDDTPRWLRPFAQDLVPALPASGSGLAALARQLGLRV
ncbi:MAG: FAD-dependent monooxygenase, partial [Planctomycetes bacterium]|nr:FAD-dependent monooxygenase [Planctomycetota bacterium]